MGDVVRLAGWVPVSTELLGGEPSESQLAVEAAQRDRMAAALTWLLNCHGWAVAHASGLARDVLVRHAPVVRGYLPGCGGCTELAAAATGDYLDWVPWPCAEYRAAAGYIDYPGI